MNDFADLIAIMIILYYLYHGVVDGFFIACLEAVGGFIAFTGACITAFLLAGLLQKLTGFSHMICAATVAAVFFTFVTIFFAKWSAGIRRRRIKDAEYEFREIELSFLSRSGGALLNFLRCFVVLTMLAWSYTALRASTFSDTPDLGKSVVVQVSRSVMSKGITLCGKLMGHDSEGELLAWLVTNPEMTKARAQAILSTPAMQKLIGSSSVRTSIEDGDREALQSSEEFKALTNDKVQMDQLQKSGLFPSTEDTDQAAASLTDTVLSMGELLKVLMKDPKLMDTLKNMKDKGSDTWHSLLANPDVINRKNSRVEE